MKEEDKRAIIQDLNARIGADPTELKVVNRILTDLADRQRQLQDSLKIVDNVVPTKLSNILKKANKNTEQVEKLLQRREKFRTKVEEFLKRTEPLQNELSNKFAVINRLGGVLLYLESFEKIESLSEQLKQCTDDEQAVLLYGELKDMCSNYKEGHRGVYIREFTHYWHNVLKEKLSKHYEEVLKQLKWPYTVGVEFSTIPKEVSQRFEKLTRFLFLIQEPEDVASSTLSDGFDREHDPCLPVRILLKPLKKRFIFHFTGSRQTARIDRPEWFLTQTLTWIKDHKHFVRFHVQPVADNLQMRHVKAVDEFISGLLSLAAERLHTVLAMYHKQGSKGEIVDVDAAFAHAVDETLGFHRELIAVTHMEMNGVLSVLTKAETFVRWLAVEKKYALSKMDEILGSEQWSEAVASGVGSAVGTVVWVPRGADWFIALLKTIEERYTVLPQPGHRLQFLELQLELVEEWRVRLTQLMNAALNAVDVATFLRADSPRDVTAAINAAHYTRTVLLQWAHSLHYLQLHYYRRQFQHFTQRQHHDDVQSVTEVDVTQTNDRDDSRTEGEAVDESLSLREVETTATKLAVEEVSRRNSIVPEVTQFDITSPLTNLTLTDTIADDDSESGVFGDAPSLLAHLRDAGLSALTERILLEFKAQIRDYKKQKWHAMLIVEEAAITVSAPLCGPLSALCARMARVSDALAPHLAQRLRNQLATAVDDYIFEEVVLENWFNTGGTLQLSHDVKRNLAPAFAPPTKSLSHVKLLPKLQDACRVLNLDYDEAQRLRDNLSRQPALATDHLQAHAILHIQASEVLRILDQRTDLSDVNTPTSLMELF